MFWGTGFNNGDNTIYHSQRIKEMIWEADAQCRICPLNMDKYTPIKAAGVPKHLRVIVVQDFPTIHDAAVGVPMTGEAGALVRALLEQNGLDPGQHVYFTSAALCWPIRNKEVVAQAALTACRDRLGRELAQFATRVYTCWLWVPGPRRY